ncbi:MAG: hypothetical protein COB78_05710 [Hyphomicrobiales bacterium]|nr:MAG: hypothetical protein COB78_05710 [Hyphomicrobiales bacterium]
MENFDLAPIKSMEPVIVDRLRMAFPEKDFAIERIPANMTINEFGRIARLSPFIGLSWVNMKSDPDSGRQLKANWGWRLFLVFKASGNLQVRFKGDARDIGLDSMSDVAIVMLQGAVFKDIGTCTVTSAEATYAEGWADDDTVVAMVNFHISTVTSPAAYALVEPDDFSMLTVAWLNGSAGDPEDQPVINQTIDIPQGD